MSKTVDHRVVEMRFDNKQFEAGAKQTMSTLTRLKEALKLPDTTKALEGIDAATKNISLDGIAAGVDALNSRFSTLGIVGMRVIENITDGLMNKLHGAVNFVTNAIVSGGIKRAMNIENAHFQLQALLKDETKVQAVMADAMESVDGTAYAYDEAAKAASQFAASGIQSGEEMLGALKGITGVAAMTNSSFEDISRVFTTVAGNGRLMGDQLLQLSSRGLNAASTLADYFKEVRGQSGMTEASIRDMVSKGKISFKDFSDAMTWAFGDSAKRANETFTGAMSNMKSALARIGAGFISPLVEQNGELVQLFNALRIKINDVKTSLVFDEQSSAINGLKEQTSLLSETYAEMFRTGTLSTDTFVKSLLEANKVEDKFGIKSNYLQETFEKLKDSGKVTTDMLNGMANMGIDATASIKEYVNGVHNGTIKASESIKKMADELASAMGPDNFYLTHISEEQIKKFVKEGKIDFELFSEAVVRSSKESMEASGVLEDALKGMFSEVKKEGHLSSEALEKFSKNGIDAADAIRKYMKGVRDGTIRASYATRTAIEELTDGVVITTGTIRDFAEEGKITYDIFQSAMENSFGNSKALSKQFTDSFQDMIHKIVVAINEMDMTKPMEAFYYGVESIKNIAKGLWSVLKPIGKAFADVFLDFNGDDVINFASAIETLTAKMRLSEKGSQNLHDAFEGIFSIAKLLVDVFFALFGAILPINKPVMEMGDGFLGIVGAIGRAITYFTKMIRSCTLLKKAFNIILSPISLAMGALAELIKILKSFGASVIKLEGAQKLVNAIENAFVSFGKKATPYIADFIGAAEEMFKSLFNIGDFNAEEVLGKISDALSDLAWEIENFSFQRTVENFENFIQKIKDLAMANESFEAFVTNIKKYAGKLKEAFSLDAITDKIEIVMSVFSKFSKWVKTTLSPALKAFFDGFSIGNAVGVAGGIGVLFAVIKAIKAIEKIGGALQSAVSLMGAVKGALVAWQKDLKADAFLKISKGILALAVAITVLSFADMKNAWQAAIMLGLVGSALIVAIGYFMKAINKGNNINQALGTFAKGLSKSMQSFTKSLKIKAIGSVIKNIGLSLMLIAGSIIALGVMYSKNPDAMNKAVKLVEGIGLVILGVGVLSALVSKFINGSAMSSIGKSLLMTMLSLTLAVTAISKLMKMDIPDDADVKIKLLEHIMVMLGGMALVLGVSALISGGNQLPKMTKSIKALVVLLVATVASLYILFKMNIPNDYEKRMDMLSGIFKEMELLILVIGAASRIAGGNGLKAAGTILSLIPLIVTIVGALLVLTLIPEDKMMAGAKALGGIIITLALALAGAGQIEKGSAAAKTVLAMAIMVGVITAALAILALVPFESLMKSTVALGLVLLTLSENFKNVAKVQSKKALPTIIAMIGAVTVISVALYALSTQPWENMLAAAAAMSVTLLAFSKSFEMILGKRWDKNNVKKIGTFLRMTLAVIPIGVAIGLLAHQPWDGMLVAAVALSGVALALTGIFFLLTKVKPDITSIAAFVAGAVALIPMAVALNMLAGQSWDSILPAIVALGAVSAILVAAMMVMSLAGPGILAGIVAFVAGAVAMIPIAMVMNMLTGLSWNDVATGLVTLAGALVIIGVAGLAGIAIAPGLLALSVALIAFGAAIAVVGVGLLAFTASLVASVALLSGLFEIFGSAIGAVKEMGFNLIAGFIGGIVEGIGNLIATVKEIGGGILGTLAEVLGIHSPSLMTWLMGKFTDEGFANGMEENADTVNNSAESVFGGILDKFNPKNWFKAGQEATTELADGITSEEDKASSAMSAVAEGLTAVTENVTSALSKTVSDAAENMDTDPLEEAGEKSSDSFISGIMEKLGGEDGLGGMISGLLGGEGGLGGFDISAFSDLGSLGGMDFMNGFETGFDMESMQGILNGNIEGLDVSSFLNVGENGSMDFMNGFETGFDMTAIQESITGGLGEGFDTSEFTNIGGESAVSWADGFKSKTDETNKTVQEFIKKVIETLKKELDKFYKKGEESAEEYIKGVESKLDEASTIGKNLGDNILKSLESIKESFKESGANAGQGYVEGLKSKLEDAKKVGSELGKVTKDATAKSLDEHSPSKEMAKIGENAGLGYINMLMLYVAKAAEAGKEIGEATVSGISFVLDDDISDPVIRPTVDLTDVNSSFNEIRDRFNEAISTAANVASSISTTLKVNSKNDEDVKQPKKTVVNNYNYEQNNYSPKALSATDIYRQTDNQFSRLKSSIRQK